MPFVDEEANPWSCTSISLTEQHVLN